MHNIHVTLSLTYIVYKTLIILRDLQFEDLKKSMPRKLITRSFMISKSLDTQSKPIDNQLMSHNNRNMIKLCSWNPKWNYGTCPNT